MHYYTLINVCTCTLFSFLFPLLSFLSLHVPLLDMWKYCQPVKPVPNMKTVQPSTAQIVKPGKAPPLLSTPSNSNEVMKDDLASSNKMAKEKEVKNKRKDDLPSIDRSTTK